MVWCQSLSYSLTPTLNGRVTFETLWTSTKVASESILAGSSTTADIWLLTFVNICNEISLNEAHSPESLLAGCSFAYLYRRLSHYR